MRHSCELHMQGTWTWRALASQQGRKPFKPPVPRWPLGPDISAAFHDLESLPREPCLSECYFTERFQELDLLVKEAEQFCSLCYLLPDEIAFCKKAVSRETGTWNRRHRQPLTAVSAQAPQQSPSSALSSSSWLYVEGNRD